MATTTPSTVWRLLGLRTHIILFRSPMIVKCVCGILENLTTQRLVFICSTSNKLLTNKNIHQLTPCNFLRKRPIGSTLGQRIITFIKLISIKILQAILGLINNKPGEHSAAIVLQLLRLLCIQVKACMRTKAFKEGWATCLNLCWVLLWIGLSSCGIPRMSLVLRRSLLLRAARNMFTMSSGVQLTPPYSQLSMVTVSWMSGTSTGIQRALSLTKKHLRMLEVFLLTRIMTKAKLSAA